ncbi:MAG: hypothetical protein NVSMB54_36970 [Ktedonobacteraceae bacterium]
MYKKGNIQAEFFGVSSRIVTIYRYRSYEGMSRRREEACFFEADKEKRHVSVDRENDENGIE